MSFKAKVQTIEKPQVVSDMTYAAQPSILREMIHF